MVSFCTPGNAAAVPAPSAGRSASGRRGSAHGPERQLDGAAAFGASSNAPRGRLPGNSARAPRRARRRRVRLRAICARSAEVRLQTFAHVFVDDRRQRAAAARWRCLRLAQGTRRQCHAQPARSARTTLRCLVAGRMSNLRRKQSMSLSSVGSALEIPRDHADGVVDQRLRRRRRDAPARAPWWS